MKKSRQRIVTVIKAKILARSPTISLLGLDLQQLAKQGESLPRYHSNSIHATTSYQNSKPTLHLYSRPFTNTSTTSINLTTRKSNKFSSARRHSQTIQTSHRLDYQEPRLRHHSTSRKKVIASRPTGEISTTSEDLFVNAFQQAKLRLAEENSHDGVGKESEPAIARALNSQKGEGHGEARRSEEREDRHGHRG